MLLVMAGPEQWKASDNDPHPYGTWPRCCRCYRLASVTGLAGHRRCHIITLSMGTDCRRTILTIDCYTDGKHQEQRVDVPPSVTVFIIRIR